MRPWWRARVTNHQKQLTSESVVLLTGICSSRGGQTRSGGGSSYVIKHFSSQQEIPLLTKMSAVLGSVDSHPDLVSYLRRPVSERQFKNFIGGGCVILQFQNTSSNLKNKLTMFSHLCCYFFLQFGLLLKRIMYAGIKAP